jgi:hypothetical protein
MSKNWFVVSNNVITNIIVADTKEIAEEVTGMTCVEYDITLGYSIGDTYEA